MIHRLLKIIVPVAKELKIRDCILHKRPIVLRSLIIVATPFRKTTPAQSRIGMVIEGIELYVLCITACVAVCVAVCAAACVVAQGCCVCCSSSENMLMIGDVFR